MESDTLSRASRRLMAALSAAAVAAVMPATAAAKPPPPLRTIYLPQEAIPDFEVYQRCVIARYEADRRANGTDVEAVRQAHRAAVAACRDVRETQLARALESLKDHGWAQRQIRRAVRRAFDIFDEDYAIEPVTSEPAELQQ